MTEIAQMFWLIATNRCTNEEDYHIFLTNILSKFERAEILPMQDFCYSILRL